MVGRKKRGDQGIFTSSPHPPPCRERWAHGAFGQPRHKGSPDVWEGKKGGERVTLPFLLL